MGGYGQRQRLNKRGGNYATRAFDSKTSLADCLKLICQAASTALAMIPLA